MDETLPVDPITGQPIASGVDQFGLPISDGTTIAPSVAIANPDNTQSGGLINTIEGYGSALVKGAQNVGEAVISGGEAAVSKVYGAGKTVVSDVGGGVENLVGFGVGQIVLIVAVVAVGLYLVGKTGAFKVSAIV